MIYIIFERKFNEHCLQDIVERYTVKLFYNFRFVYKFFLKYY